MVRLIRTAHLLRSRIAHVNNMTSLYTAFSNWLVELKRSFVTLRNDLKKEALQIRGTTKLDGHKSNGKGRGILRTTVLLSTLAIVLVVILGPNVSCLFEVSFDDFVTPFGLSNLTDFLVHDPTGSKATTLAKGWQNRISSRLGILSKSDYLSFGVLKAIDLIS